MISFETILNVATALTLIITLLYIIKYTKETIRLGDINQELLNINLDDRKPYVVVTFEEGNTFFDIILEIENVGTGLATDVKININPDYDVKDSRFNDYVNKSGAITKGINPLKPRKVHRILAGTTEVLSDNYEKGKIEVTEYEIEVSYKDMHGRDYINKYHSSIDKFFKRMNPDIDRKTFQDKQLGIIAKELPEILNKLTELSSSSIKRRVFSRKI